jgi:hypothetical protein
MEIKKIAIFTSGGDSPGMNAAIRAIVRTASKSNITSVGIVRGYTGIIEGDFIPLESESVANILQKGGTILKSARNKEFLTREGREKAYANIKKENIDAIVCIGGNGSYAGALKLENEFGIPCIGLPGTIDNDLYGTDYTIGFHTAVHNAVEAIDKIRSGNMRNNILLTIDQVGSTLNQMGRVEAGIDRNKTFIRVSNGREDHGRNPVTLHRASARAFIPNPDNHPVVMHFNDDSTNYLLENLLWGTSSDNNRGKKMRRPDTMEQKYANLVAKDVIKG